MKNHEIKVRLTEVKAVIALIKLSGADYKGVLRQTDYYLGKAKRKVKVRVINGKKFQLIVYARVERSGRKESTYTIKNLTPAEKTVLLGKNVICCVKKTRKLWTYKNTRIHLDRVNGLGDFLELETVVQGKAVKKGIKEFNEVIKLLGINPSDSIAASYVDLLS